MTTKEITDANKRARELIRMDDDWGWREMINIVGYSVVEDGVKMIPKLVAHIRELEEQLKN